MVNEKIGCIKKAVTKLDDVNKKIPFLVGAYSKWSKINIQKCYDATGHIHKRNLMKLFSNSVFQIYLDLNQTEVIKYIEDEGQIFACIDEVIDDFHEIGFYFALGYSLA